MYAITSTSYRAIDPGDPLNPGETAVDVLPPWPFMAVAVQDIRAAIQAWLDTTAAQNDYDDAASAISYIGDANAMFNADGVAMRSWRSAVWTAAYVLETSLVANPPTPWPTAEQIIAQLPQPCAYGWTVHGTPP